MQPEIVIVEPDAAPRLKASKEAGKPVRADGPVSSWAGSTARSRLSGRRGAERLADRFVTISDEVAIGRGRRSRLGDDALGRCRSRGGAGERWRLAGRADAGHRLRGAV